MPAPKGTRPPRAGMGRPKGSKNKRTVELEAAAKKAAAAIAETIPDAFDGTAVAFLMTVYRDPAQPLAMRLDAAKAAAEFEQPKLQRQEVTLDGDMTQRVISGDAMSVSDWEQSYGERPKPNGNGAGHD